MPGKCPGAGPDTGAGTGLRESGAQGWSSWEETEAGLGMGGVGGRQKE